MSGIASKIKKRSQRDYENAGRIFEGLAGALSRASAADAMLPAELTVSHCRRLAAECFLEAEELERAASIYELLAFAIPSFFR